MIYAYELILRFQSSDYDAIQSFLFENDITTFQEGEMAEDADGNIELINDDTLITIFSEQKEDLEKISTLLKKEIPDTSISLKEITTDFNQAWKEFSKPIIVSDRILIQPSWLEFEERREIEILLDPGLAFGSGSHETTLLCMRKLEEVIAVTKAISLLDVGCGSGILSILASKLGVNDIAGIDIDDLAITSSIDNAVKNNTIGINFSTSSLEGLNKKYDIVLANIISSVLNNLMPDLKKSLASGGTLILSGLLTTELSDFKRQHELEHLKQEVLGDWALLWGVLP